MTRMPTPRSNRHKANNALGAFIICGLFAAETAHVASAYPSPATPYIRAGLIVAAVVSLGLWWYYRGKAKAGD